MLVPKLPTNPASGRSVATPKNSKNATEIINIVSFKITNPLHVEANYT